MTRHPGLLRRTFALDTGYMPPASGAVEPYAESLQWSRRAIGMKLFLTLAVAGWRGYAAAIRRQLALLDLDVGGNDDHIVWRGLMRSGAIDGDDPRTGLGPNGVGGKTLTIGDVVNVDLLVLMDSSAIE